MPQTLLHCIYLVSQADLTLGLRLADICQVTKDPGQDFSQQSECCEP